MGRRICVVAAALLLGAPAGAAWAGVQDPGNVSPPDLETISTGLAQLNAEDEFEVVILGATPPDGLDAEAARRFAAEELEPRQACIVLDLPGKAVGVALGQTFVDEGVAGEALKNRVDVAFGRLAAEGRPGEGVVELARQLKVMRATGAAAPFRLPWELALVAVLGLGGAWGARRWQRRRDRRDGLLIRFAGARGVAAAAAQARQALGAAIGQRGRTGASAGLAARLLRLGDGAVAAAADVASLLGQAEAALGAGRFEEAERLALAAEARAFVAEAALAAARTAAADLDLGAEALGERLAAAGEQASPEARAAAEAGDAVACLAALARAGAIPRSPADLVADAEAAARDWLALRAAQDHQAAAAGGGAVASGVMLRRLHELRAGLTAVPVRLDEAEAGLAQLIAALAQAKPPVRVQRVATGEAIDPEGLWDLAPARHVVATGGGGAPLAPFPRGPRGRAM